MSVNIEILDWDTDFFGFKVARILPVKIELNMFDKIFNELNEKQIRLAYWQTEVNNKTAINIATKFNGLLVDVKTVYECEIIDNGHFMDVLDHVGIYHKTTVDPALLNVAIQCSMHSRYSTDPMIPSEKVNKLYETWIQKSVSHELADDVIIQSENNRVAGFITVKIRNGIGKIDLVGVDFKYRGRGIGSNLMLASLQYFIKRQIVHIEVVTQGNNKPARALYEKFGFVMHNQTDFYHFWL